MKKQKDTKKIIGTVVSFIAGVAIYFLVKQFVFTPESFDKIVMQAASEINESCPIMVDKDTRLDNAVALPDNILQYNYTLINWVKDSINVEAFEDYMQTVILNNVKTNPDIQVYRSNGTTMAYNYKDMNGVFITKISITEEQYSEN